MKQSHTVYFLLYYKSYFFMVPVSYENVVRAKLELWPRPKNKDLLLDGRRKLDEGWRLNGYDLDNYVDYYSTNVAAACGVERKADDPHACVLAKSRLELAIPALHANAAHVGPELWMRPPDMDHHPANVSVSGRMEIKVGSSVAHVVVDIRLDGRWHLDGGRKLSGGPYDL